MSSATDKALLISINSKIDKAFPKTKAKNLKVFAKRFYASSTSDDVDKAAEQEVFESVIEAWDLIQERKNRRPKLHFVQRRSKDDGQPSGSTTIYIVQDDMPFLVDSIRQGLHRVGVSIRSIHNAVFWVDRYPKSSDKSGRLRDFSTSKTANYRPEALSCFNCAPLTLAQSKHTESELREVLAHVAAAVKDFKPMIQKTEKIRDSLLSNGENSALGQDEIRESSEFISWLINNHYTFLGIESYRIKRGRSGVAAELVTDSLLGISRLKFGTKSVKHSKPLTAGAKDLALSKPVCVFSKAPIRSKVHRPAYYDYVIIKEYDGKGDLAFEHRLIGLYTSSVYYRAALEIPLIRKKVQAVLDRSGFSVNGHSYKNLLQVINVLPRDELFQISKSQLFATALEISRIQETRASKLFIREDSFGDFFSCLVYVPREIYSTEVREKIQEFLSTSLAAEEVEFNTYFSESELARIHFILKSSALNRITYNEDKLETQMIRLIKPWNDYFSEALQTQYSEIEATELFTKYVNSFPAAYKDAYSASEGVSDIALIENVCNLKDLALDLKTCVSEVGAELRFKIFSYQHQLFLSDVDPILENLGLNIISEKAFKLQLNGGPLVWLHDFSLYRKKGEKGKLDASLKSRFEDAFGAVWRKRIDDDSFNELVVTAGLQWRDVALLRAYTGVLKQIQFGYSPQFIASTLSRHATIAGQLVAYFYGLFQPDLSRTERQRRLRTRSAILRRIDKVENLSEDSVLRALLNLFDATLRTNYFQTDATGSLKEYFSFKFNSGQINGIPLPKPRFEIFVFSREMEGVHLRGGKVARGGLRWSDRREDYRTEVLGLVKAQQVKNSVIVPVGAKGGFVVKESDTTGDLEQIRKTGIECYRTFIRGLLDITDNVVEGKLVYPKQVVRKDDSDPYLVVAADKGTASFSDVANSIALEYEFWLGDGFASGGSNGYDHKQMGITARGAWISVQRHFRELGKDVQTQDFTVVGIGDMSGDVFGNGMLLSKHICLVAAFNHRNIFVDPNPDAHKSYRERQRLFNKTGSTWADYNTTLISSGGGIFSRAAKSISLSSQMKERFVIDSDKVTPDQLINLILKSPVELIWNGGIGTYVKAESENHIDVGDKTNDAVRVDACDLRCQIIAEGGNLGITQAARVEFGLNGGISLTDFIDNSAGVDCSDHEVNIKILLNELQRDSGLTDQRRRKLLESMTNDVATLVLDNNYKQVQAIGIAHAQMSLRYREYIDLITYLEEHAGLDRELEYLPKDERLEERAVKQQYLTRPEIAVLTSYMKNHLKAQLTSMDTLSEDYLLPTLYSAFPEKLVTRYRKAIHQHPLRGEIVATQLANSIVNLLGPSYFYRMVDSTACSLGKVAQATVIAREVLQIDSCWTQIEELDFKVEAVIQAKMMASVTRALRRVTRWFLRNRRITLRFDKEVAYFRDKVARFSQMLPARLPPEMAANYWQERDFLVDQGVPDDLAQDICRCEFLLQAMSFIEISQTNGEPLGNVVDIYYAIGEVLPLNWLGKNINQLPVADYWQARAREAFLDDLAWQQRALTDNLIKNKQFRGSAASRVASWVKNHETQLFRVRQVLSQLEAEAHPDYAMFSVTLRELLNLSQSTAYDGSKIASAKGSKGIKGY